MQAMQQALPDNKFVLSMGINMVYKIQSEQIAERNKQDYPELERDYQFLGEKLEARHLSIDDITEKASQFQVAIPSWGVGTGGTRFARFAQPGEPRNIFEKLDDCFTINQLVHCAGKVSPHFPCGSSSATGSTSSMEIVKYFSGSGWPSFFLQVW